MEANRKPLRVDLIGPEAIRQARAAVKAAVVARQGIDPNERKPGFMRERPLAEDEIQTLIGPSAVGLMNALDPIVRGQRRVDGVDIGWAMRMQVRYGRHVPPEPRA